ncbi:MAG: RidA family protein [Cyclobacteriaceae bacterium]|jgi:enamine deaminase RidA (YjgF/YER057c/UK114 family)|nr:RidA family protein [Flammeovirgaceae bacterium]MCZ8020645.1 RidA family protein [Cytophagales bacterium]MCZ8326896.1 RidA family protein [Cyclobacteriaceae bacterium]
MVRKNYSSGAKWEDIVGYSRAVQVGDFLEVTGTVAANEQGVVGKGDMYQQTFFALEKIAKVISEAGFSLEDVVRTRIFVTDIKRWEDVARAHSSFFKTIKPCTTLLEVKALIEPDYLVEIEASAIRSSKK